MHIAVSDIVLLFCILFAICINTSRQDLASKKYNLVVHAQLAYKTKLYGRAVNYWVEVVKLGEELTRVEDELLDNTYKSIVNPRRKALRNIIDNNEEELGSEARKAMVRRFRKNIENQCKDIINQILVILNQILIPRSDDISKIYYLRMVGDYNRYLADCLPEGQKGATIEDSKKAYMEAFELSKQKLEPTDYDRLNVAVGLSVLLYNDLLLIDEAIKIAEEALEDAHEDEIVTAEERNAFKQLKDNIELFKAAKAKQQT